MQCKADRTRGRHSRVDAIAHPHLPRCSCGVAVHAGWAPDGASATLTRVGGARPHATPHTGSAAPTTPACTFCMHAHKAWILLLASVTPPHVAARARFWLMPPLINQSCHVCTNLGLARSHATLPDRNASCLCPRGLLALSHETATSGSGVICRRSAVRLRCASLPQLRSIGTVLRIRT